MASYSIWLMDLGRSSHFKTDHLYNGFYKPGQASSMSMGQLLVKGEGRVIMIDTGVDPEDPAGRNMLLSRGYNDALPPTKMVERLGLTGDDVTDVIITHAHWDHIGAIHRFPNAHFYMQKDEYLKWLELLTFPPEFSILSRCITLEHFEALVHLCKDHRLTLLDGAVDNLFPGIHIRVAANSHSFASQLVIIETETKSYMAVGDAAYAYENFTKEIDGRYLPTATSVSAGNMRDMLETMKEIHDFCQGDKTRALIVHNCETWNYFPCSLKDPAHPLAEICLAKGETSHIEQE
ncbi:MAG: MBL fold metallo-hydrolase [Bacillota bacterium]|jgi:N-acyl homoserine lactone hydrolase